MYVNATLHFRMYATRSLWKHVKTYSVVHVWKNATRFSKIMLLSKLDRLFRMALGFFIITFEVRELQENNLTLFCRNRRDAHTHKISCGSEFQKIYISRQFEFVFLQLFINHWFDLHQIWHTYSTKYSLSNDTKITKIRHYF